MLFPSKTEPSPQVTITDNWAKETKSDVGKPRPHASADDPNIDNCTGLLLYCPECEPDVVYGCATRCPNQDVRAHTDEYAANKQNGRTCSECKWPVPADVDVCTKCMEHRKLKNELKQHKIKWTTTYKEPWADKSQKSIHPAVCCIRRHPTDAKQNNETTIQMENTLQDTSHFDSQTGTRPYEMDPDDECQLCHYRAEYCFGGECPGPFTQQQGDEHKRRKAEEAARERSKPRARAPPPRASRSQPKYPPQSTYNNPTYPSTLNTPYPPKQVLSDITPPPPAQSTTTPVSTPTSSTTPIPATYNTVPPPKSYNAQQTTAPKPKVPREPTPPPRPPPAHLLTQANAATGQSSSGVASGGFTAGLTGQGATGSGGSITTPMNKLNTNPLPRHCSKQHQTNTGYEETRMAHFKCTTSSHNFVQTEAPTFGLAWAPNTKLYSLAYYQQASSTRISIHEDNHIKSKKDDQNF